MEYKAYYYDDTNECIICQKENAKPTYELIDFKKSMIIDLNDKNIENIYNFFRNNVLESVLSDGKEILIDYSDINKLAFYKEEAFGKLVELIESLRISANDSINKCSNQDE